MKCPQDGSRLYCLDSRSREEYTYRRYECKKCGQRFSTLEQIADDMCSGVPALQLAEHKFNQFKSDLLGQMKALLNSK
jgi:transcriptional regulator NrdR family protein